MNQSCEREPINGRNHAETPTGVSMGVCAGRIVAEGPEKAFASLHSLMKTADPDNKKPFKGWRSALAGILTDASYRIARPRISERLSLIPTERYPFIEILNEAVISTEAEFYEGIDKTFIRPASAWHEEVVMHVLKQNADYKNYLKESSSTIFSQFRALALVLHQRKTS